MFYNLLIIFQDFMHMIFGSFIVFIDPHLLSSLLCVLFLPNFT